MFDYAERQRRLAERMEAEDVDVLFLAPSADLEYLTGRRAADPELRRGRVCERLGRGGVPAARADDPIFVFPRMFAAFDLQEEPDGELVVVNETDDGFAAFERVARGLGSTGTVAVGDRVWAETVLNLGRILGFDRLRTGSTLVNELRRVKTPEELEAIGRAIRTVEQTMAAAAPLVVPGATMAQLAEAVEHELRAAGSRTPSFTTHIFTGLGDGELDSRTETAHEPMPRRHVGDVRLRRRRRRLLLGLRAHDLLRRSSGSTTARSTRSCSPRRRRDARPPPPARPHPR